jgi:hypothetical protein
MISIGDAFRQTNRKNTAGEIDLVRFNDGDIKVGSLKVN